MSLLDKYLKGWTLRTTRPELTPGRAIDVFLAEYDAGEDAGLAYIGDTKLYVDGATPEHVEQQIRVEVTEFESNGGVGHGEFVEVVGGSSYSAE
ncbi:hypothetical protein SAMN06269185_0764 [Natronoarchaeum philippinense]|uniref:DUF7513 domain-containing protein n=1 Tax=Natronoarchaeum philippinense TaxID=558529 RepID=A0A285N6X4_NATPI|nr:TRAM domain-containing protein [Natronoarchaeum philippinense]SNZ05068.1 hypothetical protein SAMN06269185_0764 [Natronoarchaeum philippinense]